jgi:hypothetical protein
VEEGRWALGSKERGGEGAVPWREPGVCSKSGQHTGRVGRDGRINPPAFPTRLPFRSSIARLLDQPPTPSTFPRVKHRNANTKCEVACRVLGIPLSPGVVAMVPEKRLRP